MIRACFTALFVLPLAACIAQSPAPSQSAAPAAALPSATPTPAPPKHTYSQCYVEGPYIAMTFDDGPHGENTPRLLDMLKKRNIKATFFVVGQCVAEFPEILKRAAEEGHEIASHSWSHPQLTKLGEGGVTDQLQRTHDVIQQTTGTAPKLMRPPYGAFTANQRAWAHSKWGYKTILWDVDPLDWKVRSSSRVQSEILRMTVPGSIILAHDIHKSTVDAMPETLDALLAKGFKFVTVSELIAMDRPVPAKPKATPAPVVQPEGAPAPEVTKADPTPAPKRAAAKKAP